jgi:hypothetical protein
MMLYAVSAEHRFPLSLVTTTQYMETRGLLAALRTCLYELPLKSQQ